MRWNFDIFFSKSKLGKRMILFFMLTTILMALTSFYSYYNARMLIIQMNTMFMSNVELNALSDNVNKVQQYLEKYLATKHTESLNNYNRLSSDIKLNSGGIQMMVSSIEGTLILTDVRNMIDSYINYADKAVQAKRGRDTTEYNYNYSQASKIFNYINLYINKLNNKQFQENTSRYNMVASRLTFVQYLNIFIIVGVVVFNILLSLWFIHRITFPIINLSHSADEISKGNFDIEMITVDTGDEISIMSQAFNKMAGSIKQYIDEIKEKAELEGRLKEQEVQNLEMKGILKEAELQALQSQINPHFLYNTLNAGAQIAMLEGADKTCEFIESVSNLFRYNLRKFDKPVTLSEEVNNIDNYLFILKTRFTDRIQFLKDVDESILDINMPCMILQPIVENAFIHGIGDLEEGGKITLKVLRKDDCAEVFVSDNGKGMSKEQINNILNSNTAQIDQNHKGHTTGIGIKNVISRLRIFFSDEDIVRIYSSSGNGTEFIIRLPICKEEGNSCTSF